MRPGLRGQPHVRGLQALFALGDLELDPLTLAQGTLACPLDAGGVDEDVLAPIIRIELRARHLRLDWLLRFTKLTVSLDGKAQVLAWGTHVIPAAASTHRLDVSYGYLGKQRGPATLDVPVVDGQVTRVSYSTPPWWMSAKGKMSITP